MVFLSLCKQKIFQTKSNSTNLFPLLYCTADCLFIKVNTGYPKSCVISLNVNKNLGAATCKTVLRRYEMYIECGEQQVSLPPHSMPLGSWL